MFGFRRRIKPENPTDWPTIEQVRRIVEEEIEETLDIHRKEEKKRMDELRSHIHDGLSDVIQVRDKFEKFEQGVHAEIRTLCQNAGEATRAIAETMEIFRPTLMKIRERNLKKEAIEKCPKE